jgi:hypothetical protein
MSRPAPLTRILASAMLAGVFSSCDRPDPGMTEKVALLEAELRERDRQLATMAEEAKSESSTDASPTAGAPDLDAARGAYLGFVESLRSKLATAMPDAKFERTSVFPVEGPDPSKPILSRVAFRIVGKDGRSGEMVVPLFADPAGAWQDPEIEQVIAGFNARPAAPPAAANTAPAPQPAAAPARPQPTDVMGAERTVEVQWGDKPQQAAPQQAPATPQPAPQPQSPAVPKKVMPSSRDVIIDFE